MSSTKKKFLSKHAKSSAFTVSVIAHLVLVAIAASFVAVSVIVREDQTFEQVEISRPKVPLKKLQVPVKMEKKKTQKPKLRKRVVVKKAVNPPEIKMPEISGIKGGTGYMDDGGGLGGLGFGLDIDFFGIMGGGDHMVFIIDFSESMKGQKNIIMRREASRVIKELPIDTEFGVIFFSGPAWPATRGLRDLDNWVWNEKGGDRYHSFRPKDWSQLPTVSYSRATPGAKNSMIDRIEDTPLYPGTVYDCPIYMALRMDPLPDTIFFMTDGACPSKRGIGSLRKMVAQLKAEGKKVPKLHTIGFGLKSDPQLKQMAKLMGGESNFLTVEEYIKEHGEGKFRLNPKNKRYNVTKETERVGPTDYPVNIKL